MKLELISHDDRTLKEHLGGLKEVADILVNEKSQNFYNVKDLKELVHRLISYHDLAKGSIFFQLYLANALIRKGTGHRDYSIEQLTDFTHSNKAKFQEWLLSPDLKDHAHFGGWAFLETIEIEKRYDIDSLLLLKILKRHHGYLRNFNLASINPVDHKLQLTSIAENIEFESVGKILSELDLAFAIPNMSGILDGFSIRRFNKLIMFLQQNQDPSYYFKTLFLYSILLSADKGDVMLKEKKFRRNKIKCTIIDDFKKLTLKDNLIINNLREEAYQIASETISEKGRNNFFSITLPTGLGKTFTAYKTALSVKEKYAPDFRIVYCLPFTSIIDQNAFVFKDILTTMGLDPGLIGIHHHLSIPDNKSEDEVDYPEWEYFTEGWQNEITITTFVQFWESVFTNHNKNLRKFHNLVNSIIILDEVQSINPALIPALEFIMESMASFFNTKFILVTATQPIILQDKIQELCFKNEEGYFFKQMNRTVLDKGLLDRDKISEEELASVVVEEFNRSPKSILIICNTIRYSQNLIQIINSKIKMDEIFYLSASIIPHSREQVLKNQISPLLKQKNPLILIATQVIEAGVDVDFDLVFRDFAPLSSINQAAGRCNRNSSKGVSKVYLFRSGKEKIYDPTLLSITEKTLNKFPDKIPESRFYELSTHFFRDVKGKIQDNSAISQKLIQSMLYLNFEDIGSNKEYRLVVEKYKSYNYFISLNNESEGIWEEYLEKSEIEEHFERKNALKLLFPKMMKYVIRIPDYIHTPLGEDKEKFIIYDEDWSRFYDETFGYKKTEKESILEIF